MTHIDTAKLVRRASNIAGRANVVRKEPAVSKAAQETRADVFQASKSVKRLVDETRAAWKQTDTHRG